MRVSTSITRVWSHDVKATLVRAVTKSLGHGSGKATIRPVSGYHSAGCGLLKSAAPTLVTMASDVAAEAVSTPAG